MSAASMVAPVSSTSCTAGTHDGGVIIALSGELLSSNMQRVPLSPRTLPTSCGSAKIAVVPRGTTARPYSPTPIIELSTWMWLSMRPGDAKRPVASITLVSGPMQRSAVWCPMPRKATRPQPMAMSVSGRISPVATLT